MKEVTIEIRPDSISIQGGNIQAETDAAKALLKSALDALEEKPNFTAKNEITFKRGKHPNSRKKSSERKLKRFNRVLFEDQEGVTSERLRELIDLYGA